MQGSDRYQSDTVHSTVLFARIEKNSLDVTLRGSALDVSCGDHEFLPSSVDCVLPFKVDDDNVGLIGLDIVFLHFQSEYIQYQGVMYTEGLFIFVLQHSQQAADCH